MQILFPKTSLFCWNFVKIAKHFFITRKFGISAEALPNVDAPSHLLIDIHRRMHMFNTRTDFTLNKFDKNAIVCQSVSGFNIRLTREDFDSEEEFIYWKNWSDCNYKEIDRIGREDDACLSFEAQRSAPLPSVEDVVLSPYIEAEQGERWRRMLEQIKTCLTTKQYRRLCLYYLDGKTEAEIAAMEGITQQRISKSLISGTKIVEKFFQEFLSGRG